MYLVNDTRMVEYNNNIFRNNTIINFIRVPTITGHDGTANQTVNVLHRSDDFHSVTGAGYSVSRLEEIVAKKTEIRRRTSSVSKYTF